MQEPKFTVLTFGNRARERGEELASLGIDVVDEQDASRVPLILDCLRDASVLLLSGDVGRETASKVLADAKTRYGSLPAIWIGDLLNGAPLSDFRSSPDAILHEPVSARDVLEKVRELLEKAHAGTAAELLVEVLSGALRDHDSPSTTASPVRVNALHRLVNDVNTIVAFCGTGISGRLLVSAEESTLLGIRQKTIGPSVTASRYEAEDLAGEIANLAAGKLKFALDQLGVECEIGTPLLVGRAGAILRPSRGQPSLCVELACDDGSVRGELAIDHCDEVRQEMLSHGPACGAPAEAADVCFF